MAELPPVPQPIGIFDDFIAQGTKTLILTDKVMLQSSDDFDIKLAGSDQPIMKIKGKLMTASGRKSVFDMSDKHLFDIVKERLHLHSTYVAEEPGGNKFLVVKGSSTCTSSPHRARIQSAASTNA